MRLAVLATLVISTLSAAFPKQATAPEAPTYTPAGKEGQVYAVAAGTTLRYGTSTTNIWITKTFATAEVITASNTLFGKDPHYGVVKEVQVESGSGGVVLITPNEDGSVTFTDVQGACTATGVDNSVINCSSN